MTLNKLQQEAFDRIVVERHPLLFLTGAGGVGKTHTVASIIAEYGDPILVASTHKAKDVLSQMSGKTVTTAHSYLGYRLQEVGYKQVLSSTGKKIPHTELVLLDEVSICPNVLLEELLTLNKTGVITQLIIVGDAVQLKAVSNVPNLQQLEPYKLELTQQMRQNTCTTLANYMTDLRTGIKQTELPKLFANVPAIEFIDSHKEFCLQYKNCTTNKKIIGYRNSVVDKYNSFIHDGDTFNIGDDVIIDKPLGKARNQDTVKIVDIEETDNYYLIDVVNTYGEPFTIRNYKKSTVLASELHTYIDNEDEKGYWKLHNKSFRLKHSYAATVYKCQGESYNSVFIDAKDFLNAYQTPKSKWNNPISLDTFLRLYYVAISRMRDKAYVYTGADNKGRDYNKLK